MRRIVVVVLALAALTGVLAGLFWPEPATRTAPLASPPKRLPPGPAAVATLVVSSIPGASVSVDRVQKAVIPSDGGEVRMEGLLPGLHLLRVAVPHLQAYVEEVELPAGSEVVRRIPSFRRPLLTKSFEEMPSLTALSGEGALLILTIPDVCAIQCPTLDWSDHLKVRRWLAVWNVPPGKHVLRFEFSDHVAERTVIVKEGEISRIGVDVITAADIDFRDLDYQEPPVVDAVIPGAGLSPRVMSLDISADGARAVSCDGTWRIRLWERGSSSPTEIARGMEVTNRVVISRSGSHVAAPDFDHRVWVWEVASKKRIATFEDTRGAVQAIAIAPAGESVAATDSRGNLLVWNVPARRLLWSHATGSVITEDLAFSPDGSLVAVANGSGSPIQMFDVATGKLLRSFGNGRPATARVAITRDPPQVLSIREDGSLRIWDSSTGEPASLAILEKWDSRIHGGTDRICRAIVRSLAFQHEDAASFDAIVEAVGSAGEIAISADGKHVATGDLQGNVRFVDLK